MLLLLIGCNQSKAPDRATPTPFATESARFRNPATEPITISLTHLATNPDFFEGSTLQLSGQYRRLPVLACDRDSHPGPATWGIVNEGLMASASGQDEQLRTLLRENQQITVEGHWIRYIGPIGCGKAAPVEELWYLSVNQIIEPHPLARATAEPVVQSGEPTVIASNPNPSVEPIADTPTSPPLTQTIVPSVATNTPANDIANATNTATPVSSPTAEQTPSPTVISATGTITASVTMTTTPTTTPVATQEGQQITNRGPIDYEDLIIETLNAGTRDRWTLPIDSSESITITAAPANNANLIITVLDESGVAIVDGQDQAPAGEVETIRALELTDPDIYQILISSPASTEITYALMVMNSESYAFNFRGALIPSSPRSDSLQSNNDHFWFFPLSDGDVFNIRVIPSSQSDPYLELYDPAGSRVSAIDDTGIGESETIEAYEALLDGLYAIRVGEFEYKPMSYQILLTEP